MAVKQAKKWNEVAVRKVLYKAKVTTSLFDVMIEEIFETTSPAGPKAFIRYWKTGKIHELEVKVQDLEKCEVIY